MKTLAAYNPKRLFLVKTKKLDSILENESSIIFCGVD